ncbi:homeobox protein 2-like [Biomphalaria glabrata]|uniref:Homeobox protein 2-like n=1 Tax=Biomphalaria glabrata TaxID=6526 RepID=A0A9W3A3I3_BIOGL|nr:homeobox protein 2-like [Biomphalaria glabrata]XP_055881741.1 homeobox protein 2-like [Biomphalaria glabrata]XP_055881742.1 homeobox protein 2-like [Biomphalaria glabrata]XP_055881743.1 homeobox protein 2-like [Biomphalaria glabrata]
MSTYDKILELASEMELKGEKKREFIERELDELKKKEREVAERDERAAERAHQKEMKEIEGKVELAKLEAAKVNPNILQPLTQQAKPYVSKFHKFNEKNETLENYIVQFEHIASTYDMSPRDMAKHLLANLAGEPLNIIATLTPEQKTDYKAVKNRLLEHFGKSEDHYRKLFRDIRLQKNGDYNRIIFEIKQNILKWLELSNCDMMRPDQIIDMFLIDSVLLNVTDNIFTFLKEKKIKNETELITNLNLFKDSHPNHTIDRRDHQIAATINTDSSKFKYSSNNKTCFNCGIKGHIKSQCRSINRSTIQYQSGTYRDNKYDNRRNSRATQSYSPNDRRKQYNTNNDNYNFQNYQRRQQYNTNNFQNYHRQSRRDGYERNRYNRNTSNRWQSNSNNRIHRRPSSYDNTAATIDTHEHEHVAFMNSTPENNSYPLLTNGLDNASRNSNIRTGNTHDTSS